jgi:hypothetical protein
MTQPTKEELLREVKKRYLQADYKSKIEILNEFCNTTGYHRKHAIRVLAAGYSHKSPEQRKKRLYTYSTDFFQLVIKIWELLEYPCGKRLQTQLLPMAESLERSREIPPLEPKARHDLITVSAKTLDRRLGRERIIRRLKRNRGTTRHGSLLKSSIPIRITNWDTRRIGFMEMDTVAHCDDDLSGEFIYSLDMVEIATGWSEQIAVMGKGEAGIVSAIEEIKKGLPFELKGLDSDTGSEFVNWHMVRWCKENNLSFTRSRPYYKNDNAYVEQKNYTHIRQWLGYRRYDKQAQLQLINDLYRNELRRFNNYFRPVMKISSKEKVNNSVCKKKYGAALTPYQRLMNSKQIPPETKAKLQKLYESLNPVKLKEVVKAKLKRIQKS